MAFGLVLALGGACRGEAPGEVPRAQGEDSRAELDTPSGEGAARAAAPEGAAIESISDDLVIQALVAEAEANSEVEALARHLAVDIGPRLTGSGALVDAEEWAVDTLAGWGLEAERERWGELAVGFDRGPASGSVVRPREPLAGLEGAELAFVTDAWSPGTKGPVRGRAVRMPTTDAELRNRKPYLRGAWVLVGHDPERGGPAWPRGELGGRMLRSVERGTIAGFVVAAGGPNDTLLHTHGDHDVEWGALPKGVTVRLRGDQHAALSAAVDAGDYVELEFDVDNHFIKGPLAQHNVVATLAGDPDSGRANQRVIIGGHLDSWDGASGAIDNATGVATAMEAARLISRACAATGRRPARSIQVMLWTGEEQGLLGSRAWVEQHPEALRDISAVLVHDGGTNYLSGIPVTPEMRAQMDAVFAPVLALERRRALVEGEAGEAMPFGVRTVESLIVEPSDSAPFIHADVPAFYWDQAGRSSYARYHHTQHDHFDAIIDRYQRRSALVVAIAAWGLANAEGMVERANAGPIPRRQLGVLLEDMVVTEVLADSVAGEAGLEVGARIVAVDDEAVTTVEALVAAIGVGEARKTLAVEGEGGSVELRVDWSQTEGERERARRREERARRFGGDGDRDE